jgi:hypothetical protein
VMAIGQRIGGAGVDVGQRGRGGWTGHGVEQNAPLADESKTFATGEKPVAGAGTPGGTSAA